MKCSNQLINKPTHCSSAVLFTFFQSQDVNLTTFVKGPRADQNSLSAHLHGHTGRIACVLDLYFAWVVASLYPVILITLLTKHWGRAGRLERMLNVSQTSLRGHGSIVIEKHFSPFWWGAFTVKLLHLASPATATTTTSTPHTLFTYSYLS